MVPVPVAVRITEVVPVALAPRAMLPLTAVVVSDKVPVAVIDPDVTRAALLDTEKLCPVDAPGPIVNVPPLLVYVTSPVVLAVRLLMDPFSVLILPEPEDRFNVVAVIEPPV